LRIRQFHHVGRVDIIAFLLPQRASAIPAFARLYATSCMTSHRLSQVNDFSEAFKDAGFQFPKDDETYIKVPPILPRRRSEADFS
jgi:hypothetical protein